MSEPSSIDTPNALPALVGILVDVSGSMKNAIGSSSGESLNRLQAFEKSLGDFAVKARDLSRGGGNGESIQLFAYGFGFGNPLAALLGRSGPPVRDLFARRSSQSTLVSVERLADSWQDYRDNVRSLAIEMFGSTPMVEGFRTARGRFASESESRDFGAKMLFVLSDGEPTDGSSADVAVLAAMVAAEGVLVVSCYVTDQDVTVPRTLYDSVGPDWPAGATLMFDCASSLPRGSPFAHYLQEHHWNCPAEAKLFTQINQSEIMSEFLGILVGSADSSTRANLPATRPGQVFISYSHRDQDWLDRLRVHLKPLERSRHLELWDDSRIRTGDDWQRSISNALQSASIAVLLVSADFLASDYIANNELPPLLLAARTRGVRILPVLIRPSRFEQTAELARFQSLNPPSSPLSALPEYEQERFLVQLSHEIENAIQSFAM